MENNTLTYVTSNMKEGEEIFKNGLNVFRI